MKKSLLFLIAGLVCFTFVACDNSKEPDNSDNTAQDPSLQAGKNLVESWEGDGKKHLT